MTKTAIIIPSRLNAQRLPNKPLKLINKKEMILHVYDAAVNAKTGEVYVASPDKEIIETVINYGGKAIKTSDYHETGTDRVYEVFEKELNCIPEIIINLQGDMPNIKPEAISKLVTYMSNNKCDIATLASDLKSKSELENVNVVKVALNEKLTNSIFLSALDFFRANSKTLNLYHHVGIYAFTKQALIRYVSLSRSKLEIERKLEQLRALENDMSIHVGYINSYPLSVDTKEDFEEIKRLMEK